MSLALGEPGYAYYAQTFVADGEHMQSLDLSMKGISSQPTNYHVLIVSVDFTSGFHPTQVLKEVNGIAPPTGVSFQNIHIDLDGVTLIEGKTYAFILDAFVTRNGVDDGAWVDFSPDVPGYFTYYDATGGTRADHFAATWSPPSGDLKYTAVFSQLGNTIEGTKKGDLIDAANTPAGQPVVTALDDLIHGNGGKDRMFGLDGFDTLDGGKKNDKLYGGNDGDTLIGGKGHDRLFGDAGADNLVFDFKMTKHSAEKNFDRIGNFSTAEDSIQLKQTVFTALAIGDLPDTDTHITLVNGNLLYDGIKFAKFLPGVAPASVDDIHFVVYDDLLV